MDIHRTWTLRKANFRAHTSDPRLKFPRKLKHYAAVVNSDTQDRLRVLIAYTFKVDHSSCIRAIYDAVA